MEMLKPKYMVNAFFMLLIGGVIGILKVNCQRKTSIGKFVSTKFDVTKLNSDYAVFSELLKPIAITRVSDTPSNLKVRKYLSDKMKSYGWLVQTQKFSSDTPYGKKNFENIIANYPIGTTFSSSKFANVDDNTKFYLNKRIVFACHFDSKYFADIEFIGAIDSAVPCAILLDMAKYLKENYDPSVFSQLTRHIQFIFFDGEEAFKDWTATDSIYGSRNLADSLAGNYGQKAFDTIDLLVLLDLIGAESCQFPNYFSATSKTYTVLNKIEKMLINKRMLSTNDVYYFRDLSGYGRNSPVEDDHVPFLKKNVPILHLIPIPFPPQWHTKNDNVENLKPERIQDLRLIMKTFLMQILNKKQENNHVTNEEL